MSKARPPTTGPFCLEDFIAGEAPVREIDAYFERIDYAILTFWARSTQDNGWLCFHPSLLLRFYNHGYLNGIHSSRRLEGEWLCHSLMPKYQVQLLVKLRELLPVCAGAYCVAVCQLG